MFERFAEPARRVVVLAQEESRLLRHDYIGTEHLLLGLLRAEEGLAALVLAQLDITVEGVRYQVARIVGQGDDVATGQIPFTPRAKKILELSLREALSLGHNYIGTEHILLGLVRENQGVAARILLDFDADAEKIRNEIIRMLAGRGSIGLVDTPEPEPPEVRRVELTSPPLAQDVIEELGRLAEERTRLSKAQAFNEAADVAGRAEDLRHAAERLVLAWQRHMGDRT